MSCLCRWLCPAMTGLTISQAGSILYSLGKEMDRSSYIRGLSGFILVSNRKENVDTIWAGGKGFRLGAEQAFGNSIAGENYFIYQVNSF